MGTKIYKKGYGSVGFDFRRFLVKESKDLDLGMQVI